MTDIGSVVIPSLLSPQFSHRSPIVLPFQKENWGRTEVEGWMTERTKDSAKRAFRLKKDFYSPNDRFGIKKATKSTDFIASVPHTRVELVIYCVRGSCPGPLDECGFLQVISLSKSGAKVQLFSDMVNFLQYFFWNKIVTDYYTIFYILLFSLHPLKSSLQKGIYIPIFTKNRHSLNVRFLSLWIVKSTKLPCRKAIGKLCAYVFVSFNPNRSLGFMAD